MPSSVHDAAGRDRRVGIAASVLYLVNLMLAPGLAFVAIVMLWRGHRDAGPLARGHLDFALFTSIAAGVLLVAVNGLIVIAGGYGSPSTWVIVILWFTIAHSSLILAGVWALTRALAGQPPPWPPWRSQRGSAGVRAGR